MEETAGKDAFLLLLDIKIHFSLILGIAYCAIVVVIHITVLHY